MNHHAASRLIPSSRRSSGTLVVALVLALAPLGARAETCSDPAGTTCTSDGNPCTTDECDGNGTCVHANNSEPCTDSLFCNGPDTCSGGTCSVHGGNPCAGGGECANSCNEAAQTCFSPLGTPCTGDGNNCTDDRCDGTGLCTHPANNAPCSDGLFCNGPETCSGGACSVHAGDPCTGGTVCSDSCNEAADNCLDAAGTACADDGNACTTDACDGSGTCAHAPRSAGTICRPISRPCDADEACDGTAAPCPSDGFQPDGTSCLDANPCTSEQTCTGGVCSGGELLVCPLCDRCDDVGGCLPAPQPFCRLPGRQRSDILIVRSPTGTGNRVLWKWRNGDATPFDAFGDPVVSDDYAFCVYEDGGNSLLFKAIAPAGAAPFLPPYWRISPPGGSHTVAPKSLRYSDPDGDNDGMQSVRLVAGEAGRAKIILKARGAALPLPNFSYVDLPLLVQLQHENAEPGECWEATFSFGTTANGGGVVRAWSD